jgi:hypothetical protein
MILGCSPFMRYVVAVYRSEHGRKSLGDCACFLSIVLFDKFLERLFRYGVASVQE